MTFEEIEQHLSDKFDAFCFSLKNLDNASHKLIKALRSQAFFAGGCIYRLYHDEKPKDYDIFLKSNRLIEDLKNLQLWSYRSENALTLGNVQIIIKWYGEPEQVVNEFDFLHNMYWYDVYTGSIETVNYIDEKHTKPDYCSLIRNVLVFNESRARDIENVYMRIDKFLERGMILPTEEREKILKKCDQKKLKEMIEDKQNRTVRCNNNDHY